MGVNSLPKIVTRQRPGCDLSPGPSALESSTLTTRLPSYPRSTSLILYRKITFISRSSKYLNGIDSGKVMV